MSFGFSALSRLLSLISVGDRPQLPGKKKKKYSELGLTKITIYGNQEDQISIPEL